MKLSTIIFVTAITLAAAEPQGWFPHEGGLLRYRVNIRFGEEPDTMPAGWKFGRVSAVAVNSLDEVFVFQRGSEADPIIVSIAKATISVPVNAPPALFHPHQIAHQLLDPAGPPLDLQQLLLDHHLQSADQIHFGHPERTASRALPLASDNQHRNLQTGQPTPVPSTATEPPLRQDSA